MAPQIFLLVTLVLILVGVFRLYRYDDGTYSTAPVVQLRRTKLVGRAVTPLKQDFFGGIPFAKPPLGPLRLQPPVLQTSLNVAAFDARNFGLTCLQSGAPISSISEDCLTINVLRPSVISAKLPVMVWIYGGGFVAGASSLYIGSGIVARSVARGTPVIYVSMNYRLGPLGFPQGQEAQDRNALNLGLKDQLAGLEWIKANIAAFGGDETKVTVFGQSAGAVSIGVLFLNSGLEKLARAAIFESGSADIAPLFPASHREAVWQNLVGAVPECTAYVNTTNTFACLQAVNSSTLLTASKIATARAGELFPWIPTLDGASGLIPDLPSRLWAEGKFARLPFIAGTNLDEGTVFSPQTVNSEAEIYDFLLSGSTPSPAGPAALNQTVNTVLQLYPDLPALGSPFDTGDETFGLSSQYKRFAAVVGDMYFQSQRRLWSQTASGSGVKTFGYLFNDPGARYLIPELVPGYVPGSLGVFHGSEIPFVHGGLVDTTPSSAALSVYMTDYWISFATSLDPNDSHGSPRPHWTQYTPDNQVLLQLQGNNLTLIPDTYRDKQIAFLTENAATFSR